MFCRVAGYSMKNSDCSLPELVNLPTDKKILVTGATGYIGRYLVTALNKAGFQVTLLVRDAEKARQLFTDTCPVLVEADLERPGTMTDIFDDIEIVIHLAGYAHHVGVSEAEEKIMHQRITVEGTYALLEAMKTAGTERIIYASSVKAMGEFSKHALTEGDPERPQTAYGMAKLQAEQLIRKFGNDNGLEYTIVRIPMVYGPHSPGNITRMIDAIGRKRFPALLGLTNKRSMVHVCDVVQLLLRVLASEKSANQLYLVTDRMEYSTSDIYRLIRHALGLPPRRFGIPLPLLRTAAIFGDLIGRMRQRPFFINTSVINKLTKSSYYSCSKAIDELGYQPLHDLPSALPEMIECYRQCRT